MMASGEALLVYGATGYTGRLVAAEATRRGLRPILAGRDEATVATLAARLGCAHRVARLDDVDALATALAGVRVVVHAAGPFSRTAAPMLSACLAAGAHYLDLTGEVAVLDATARRHAEARRRGIMLMPGVGFDVVASDCLGAHVARRVADARRLDVGLRGFTAATRGSLQTLLEHAGRDVVVRRGGALVAVPAGSLERRFDYGDGPRASLNVAWGDVCTAWYTSGVADVTTYVEATPSLRLALGLARPLAPVLTSAAWQTAARAWTARLPQGPVPTTAQAAGSGMVVVAEAADMRGRRAVARLRTPEPYTFSAAAAATIAARVLAGDVEPGFQTPARVYGPELASGLPGVTREDVA